MERRWLGSRRSETVGDLAPEGTNPGHVGRKQRHTRVALNAHTGCVASAPHQNHQHHIHNSCTSPPPRRTSHHIAYIHTLARTHPTSPPSPSWFRKGHRFFDKFHPPALDRDRDCATKREPRFLPFLFFARSGLTSSWIRFECFFSFFLFFGEQVDFEKRLKLLIY